MNGPATRRTAQRLRGQSEVHQCNELIGTVENTVRFEQLLLLDYRKVERLAERVYESSVIELREEFHPEARCSLRNDLSHQFENAHAKRVQPTRRQGRVIRQDLNLCDPIHAIAFLWDLGLDPKAILAL